MKCNCEAARREARDAALEEAAEWCAAQRRAWTRETHDVARADAKASAYSAAATHIRSLKSTTTPFERIAANRKRVEEMTKDRPLNQE